MKNESIIFFGGLFVLNSEAQFCSWTRQFKIKCPKQIHNLIIVPSKFSSFLFHFSILEHGTIHSFSQARHLVVITLPGCPTLPRDNSLLTVELYDWSISKTYLLSPYLLPSVWCKPMPSLMWTTAKAFCLVPF